MPKIALTWPNVFFGAIALWFLMVLTGNFYFEYETPEDTTGTFFTFSIGDHPLEGDGSSQITRELMTLIATGAGAFVFGGKAKMFQNDTQNNDGSGPGMPPPSSDVANS